jgi:hypothetical protein
MPKSAMPKTLPVLLASAAALAACAPAEGNPARTAAAPEGRQCFFASQVSGFGEAPDGPEGRDRVYIHTGPRDVYLFETWGSCFELDFAYAIGFDPSFSGSVCTGDRVDLVIPRGVGAREAERCPVQMIRKLTPEEEAAL